MFQTVRFFASESPMMMMMNHLLNISVITFTDLRLAGCTRQLSDRLWLSLHQSLACKLSRGW